MTTPFLHQLTGSFAQPCAENPTVVMVEAAYRHHGLPWRYLNCEVAPADLAAAVRGARAMGWVGFNCSLPHKVTVIEHLDGLAASAEIIGAVNTVVMRDGRWIGENTDGQGFVQALRQVCDVRGQRVVLFGAGGAARAVAVELALAGVAHVDVVNRSVARGEELAALLNARTPASANCLPWEPAFGLPANTGIVVNTTSLGLHPHVHQRLDIDWDSLKPHMIVADAIPNPPRTHLISHAAERGCLTLDGLGMLVNQGAIAIRLWTGVEADRGVMRAALERALGVH
ncbi:MAG: shikimate dehydrogenase [Burkholderiaceae bacterium]